MQWKKISQPEPAGELVSTASFWQNFLVVCKLRLKEYIHELLL